MQIPTNTGEFRRRQVGQLIDDELSVLCPGEHVLARGEGQRRIGERHRVFSTRLEGVGDGDGQVQDGARIAKDRLVLVGEEHHAVACATHRAHNDRMASSTDGRRNARITRSTGRPGGLSGNSFRQRDVELRCHQFVGVLDGDGQLGLTNLHDGIGDAEDVAPLSTHARR